MSSILRLIRDIIYIIKFFGVYGYYMDYKERIKELRLERKLSQMQLAKKLDVSQSAVAKWELGKTEPTASAIVKMAKFFGETADYILGLED